jgi:hypothetical protein
LVLSYSAFFFSGESQESVSIDIESSLTEIVEEMNQMEFEKQYKLNKIEEYQQQINITHNSVDDLDVKLYQLKDLYELRKCESGITYKYDCSRFTADQK